MRIAFVLPPHHRATPPGLSSLGIWTHEVAARLAGSHEVLVYGSSPSSRACETVHGGTRVRLMPLGISRKLVGLLGRLAFLRSARRPLFSSRYYYIGYGARVARDIARQRCEAVHVHDFTQFLPPLRAHNAGARIGIQMHNEWLTRLDRRMILARLRAADHIFGCSEHVTGLIKSGFPEYAARCAALPNVVDTSRFSPAAGEHRRRSPAGARVLFVGRISPEKGLHTLVEAFAGVAARRSDARLDLVGPNGLMPFDRIVRLATDARVAGLARFYDERRPDSYRRHLERRIAGLALGDRVRFLGPVPYEEIGASYAAADVLVNPALSEAFGRSLIEAMACGVPVVATRVGGMKEIVVEGQTGLFVEPDAPTELAGAILKMLESEPLRHRMGAAGRLRAERLYSSAKIAGDLVRLYRGG